MRFRVEMGHGCHREEETTVVEKDEREWSTQGYSQGEHIPKATGWANERSRFL